MKLQYKDNYLTSSLSYDDYYSALSCTLFGPLSSTKSELEGKCSFESDDIEYGL